VGSRCFGDMASHHWQIGAPTWKTAWWSHLLCLHFAVRCDTSILWLISMHSVTCFVTNTATVFTYSDIVGSRDIWCHSGALLELVLLARKSNGPKLLFWNNKFSYSIFSLDVCCFQVSILLDWLIGGRAVQ